MNHRIRLQLNDVEGALLRAVGVAQRRGFTITEAHFGRSDPGRAFLELGLESADRAIDVLTRQLARLHEVAGVELASQESLAPRAEFAVAGVG